MANTGVPLGQWSGSDATDRLRAAVETNATKTDKQNFWLLVMTGVILGLTIIITLLTALMWAKA